MDWWNVISVLYVVVALVLSIHGIKKRSEILMFLGITFLLTPIFYVTDCLKLFLAFVPLIAMGIANHVKKKKKLNTDSKDLQ